MPTARRLRDVLDGVVIRRGWRRRLDGERAIALWPSVVGPQLAAHSVALSVQAGLLRVAVDDGAWATQLTYFRSEVLRRLRVCGVPPLRDIVFRVGIPPGVAPPPSGNAPGGLAERRPAPPEAHDTAARLGAQAGALSDALRRAYLAAASRGGHGPPP